MIRSRVDVASIVSEPTAEERKTISKFSTTSWPSDKKFRYIVVAWKFGYCVALVLRAWITLQKIKNRILNPKEWKSSYHFNSDSIFVPDSNSISSFVATNITRHCINPRQNLADNWIQNTLNPLLRFYRWWCCNFWELGRRGHNWIGELWTWEFLWFNPRRRRFYIGK